MVTVLLRDYQIFSPEAVALLRISEFCDGGLFSVSEQMKLLGECSGSIDSVRRLERKLREEEENFPGFVNLNNTETQTAGE